MSKLPLLVIDEHGDWRRVRDPEGGLGWVNANQLSSYRTAIVQDENFSLYAEADVTSEVMAYAEKGAILTLVYCDDLELWCRFTAQGLEGWGRSGQVWGAAPPTEQEAFPEGRFIARNLDDSTLDNSAELLPVPASMRTVREGRDE